MHFTAVSSCLEIKFCLGIKKRSHVGKWETQQSWSEGLLSSDGNTALLRLGLAGALQRYGLVKVMFQVNVGGFSFGLVCFFQS